ncbi:MAG: hypothetical protein HY904_13145 [Deltaproteobacteria bacterium]|nr:hypothetical protein [Deltaproteobacteria bacterium]
MAADDDIPSGSATAVALFHSRAEPDGQRALFRQRKPWHGTPMHLDINIIKHHDACMRTTLTLDDDVAAALKRAARRSDGARWVGVNGRRGG